MIDKLTEKLRDKDPAVRRMAVGALRMHGSRALAALPTLLELMTDEDRAVQMEAERTVALLRSVAA